MTLIYPVTIAARYARALFELARDQHVLKDILRAFQQFHELLQTVPSYEALLKHNILSRSEFKDFLETLQSQLDFPDLFKAFLGIICAQKRIHLLGEINNYLKKFDAHHNRYTPAVLTTAYALSEAEIQRIKNLLQAQFNTDIALMVNEDPTLMGGFRVRINNTIFDASYAAYLKQLSHALED